jgi:outer membrane lipoprotein SlyB
MEEAMKTLDLSIASLSLLASAAAFAPPALAACNNCGTVLEVRTVEKKGEASGGGAVLGGIVGGVIGHQIGSGRGNTAATVAGAAGGAYAGHQVEKNRNAVNEYHVLVNMETGKDRTFIFKNPPKYKSGDAVRIIDGKLQLAK